MSYGISWTTGRVPTSLTLGRHAAHTSIRESSPNVQFQSCSFVKNNVLHARSCRSMTPQLQRSHVRRGKLARRHSRLEQSVKLESSWYAGGFIRWRSAMRGRGDARRKVSRSHRPFVSGTAKYDQTMPIRVRPAKTKAVLAPRSAKGGVGRPISDCRPRFERARRPKLTSAIRLDCEGYPPRDATSAPATVNPPPHSALATHTYTERQTPTPCQGHN
jgi:hypothetical protein